MSRTHRRPKYYITTTLEKELIYVTDNYKSRNGDWGWERYRKTDEECNAELAKAILAYEVKYKKFMKSTEIVYVIMRLSRKPPVKPTNVNRNGLRKVAIHLEDVLKEAKEDYSKYTRDGHWNESNQNQKYKKMCRNKLRQGNKKLEKKIIKDELYDDKPYPSTKEGKPCYWYVW
jgi:hypothetical protein